MKTMCPPGYHHNGFVATHALGHKTIVVITGRAHCFHDYIVTHELYLLLMSYKPKYNSSVINVLY